jgi:hypothetical protein
MEEDAGGGISQDMQGERGAGYFNGGDEVSEHTKEPWRIGVRKNNYKIEGSKEEMEILQRLGKVSFEALSIGMDEEQIAIIPLDESSEANARRIVACVNACAGINTEDLQGIIDGTDKRPPWLTMAWEEIERIRKQRDELLGALEKVATSSEWDYIESEIQDSIASAVARVRGAM